MRVTLALEDSFGTTSAAVRRLDKPPHWSPSNASHQPDGGGHEGPFNPKRTRVSPEFVREDHVVGLIQTKGRNWAPIRFWTRRRLSQITDSTPGPDSTLRPTPRELALLCPPESQSALGPCETDFSASGDRAPAALPAARAS